MYWQQYMHDKVIQVNKERDQNWAMKGTKRSAQFYTLKSQEEYRVFVVALHFLETGLVTPLLGNHHCSFCSHLSYPSDWIGTKMFQDEHPFYFHTS